MSKTKVHHFLVWHLVLVRWPFREIFLGWIWGGLRTALTYIYHIFPHICPPVTQSWRHEHEKEWERGWSDPYSRIRSNLLLITARPSPSLSRQRGVKQAEPSSPHDPSDNSSVNTHTHKKTWWFIWNEVIIFMSTKSWSLQNTVPQPHPLIIRQKLNNRQSEAL